MEHELGDPRLHHVCAVETVEAVGAVDALLSLKSAHVAVVHEQALLLKDVVPSLLDEFIHSAEVVACSQLMEVVIDELQKVWLKPLKNFLKFVGKHSFLGLASGAEQIKHHDTVVLEGKVPHVGLESGVCQSLVLAVNLDLLAAQFL